VSLLVALLLGVVEGLTEYLPVSSTGHLLLVSRALHVASEKNTAFDIVIQFGAILAVLAEYRALLFARIAGLARRERASIDLFVALAIGFVPTAALGLLVHGAIKAHLTGPVPIAAALIAGGVLMVVVERVRKARKIEGETGLEHVTAKRALAIGIGQCFSMWPGASRSMCTIVAGQLSGLSTATAAEFSFLLGLPTLGAATTYEAWKSRRDLFSSSHESLALAIGLVTSFVVAWLVIRIFLAYLKRRGLEPFGIYRIVLGAVVLGFVLHG